MTISQFPESNVEPVAPDPLRIPRQIIGRAVTHPHKFDVEEDEGRIIAICECGIRDEVSLSERSSVFAIRWDEAHEGIG